MIQPTMFCCSVAAEGAAADATVLPPFRVVSIAVKDATFKIIAAADCVAFFFRIFEQCVAPAEQRLHAHCGSNDDIPAALVNIEVRFTYDKHVNVSILDLLASDYLALVCSLKVLTIQGNRCDESGAALGAFAALATHLQELTFLFCGLTSLQGLEGRCEYLRKVNLFGCEHLSSIDALVDRVYLEEVDVSFTGIASIEPLQSCPKLTTVNLTGCPELSSIDALADHQWLEEVAASRTGITSIEPLRSCSALTKVILYGCQQLPAYVCLPATVTVIR